MESAQLALLLRIRAKVGGIKEERLLPSLLWTALPFLALLWWLA